MHISLAAKLAWANIINDPRRLLVRCAGITFAVVLMFMQTGFRNALFDSNVRLMEQVDADFLIRSQSRYMLSSGQQLDANELKKAKDCPGVISVEPIYIENVASTFRKTNEAARKIRVIAFDVQSDTFSAFDLDPASVQRLVAGNDTAVADTKSKSIYKLDVSEISPLTQERTGELQNRKITLVGTFDLGIDFSNNGNLIMTPASFAAYFPFRGQGDPFSSVDYGVIRISPDADVEEVRQDLQNLLSEYTRIDTKAEFLQSERDFWGSATPIGLIFLVGTIIGFVVGLIICYQVLATDIADHLGEFATLKAMGYPGVFFGAVVVFQALFLSLFAFFPGMLITLGAFQVMNQFTGLYMFLNFTRASSVLILTMTMCVLSGIIALRRLLSTDPASLF